MGGIRIIGIVVGVIAAIWVYSDAKKRGMNAIGWAIGTFLVCIVFLPLYLIIRKPVLMAGGIPPGTPVYMPPPGYQREEPFGLSSRMAMTLSPPNFSAEVKSTRKEA